MLASAPAIPSGKVSSRLARPTVYVSGFQVRELYVCILPSFQHTLAGHLVVGLLPTYVVMSFRGGKMGAL